MPCSTKFSMTLQTEVLSTETSVFFVTACLLSWRKVHFQNRPNPKRKKLFSLEFVPLKMTHSSYEINILKYYRKNVNTLEHPRKNANTLEHSRKNVNPLEHSRKNINTLEYYCKNVNILEYPRKNVKTLEHYRMNVDTLGPSRKNVNSRFDFICSESFQPLTKKVRD